MEDKPSFKGSIMSENVNRAFMYGESVFTTMRMVGNHISDWDYHFDRLKKGVDFLYGPFKDGDNWTLRLKHRLKERVEFETGDHVIRLTVYREQARGLVRKTLLSVDDLKIHVSSSPYDPSRSSGKMFALRTCAVPPKPHWWPDYLKAGNYLETILTQKMFMQPGDDDVLFLSPSDTVLESSVANIFVVKHNILYTAPTGPNVLDGVMRKKVIKVAETFFTEFKESETSIDQLYKADAVFGTNSVRGPFLIEKIDGREIKYSKEFLAHFDALKNKVLS